MATIVVLGVGLQGQAVAHELASLEPVGEVVAADLSLTGVAERLLGRHQPEVVVCMVPPALQMAVAKAAITAGAHFVSSSYTGDLSALDAEARARGLMLLPEMGLDPGIDLLLCRLAVDELDEVRSLESYGAGLLSPARDVPPRALLDHLAGHGIDARRG